MGLFDRFRKKRQGPAAGSAGEPGSKDNKVGTRLCFVLCGSADAGDLSGAQNAVEQVFGPGYSAEVGDGNIVTVSRGEEVVGFLAHMPTPIPNGEAEHAADGNVLWPNGKAEAAAHRSHVIVTNIGAGDLTPIQTALGVTRLALVALKVFNGISVYWGNASVSHSRKMFESFCEDISEEHVPVPAWIRLQLFPAHGGAGIYTLGMSQFGLMDIEVDQCAMEPQALFEFVSNIAHYLIQKGPVIADGNTVGGSAEQRILVLHRPSMIDKDRKVYKIVFN